MHNRRIIAIITCLFGSAAACSSSRMQSNPGSLEPAQRTQRSVTVRNDNWLDVRVYVVRNGGRFRLATVHGMRSATIPLPRTLVMHGTVRLHVDPIGSPATYTSEAIVVAPGQRVVLNVHSRLNMSWFAVRNR